MHCILAAANFHWFDMNFQTSRYLSSIAALTNLTKVQMYTPIDPFTLIMKENRIVKYCSPWSKFKCSISAMLELFAQHILKDTMQAPCGWHTYITTEPSPPPVPPNPSVLPCLPCWIKHHPVWNKTKPRYWLRPDGFRSGLSGIFC